MRASSAAHDNGGSSKTGIRFAPASPRAICLERDGDDLLLLTHLPEQSAPQDTAVLLLGPFGWQGDCAYRGLRTWADELAQAGYPAARLTLPSTGDSAGTAHDPGRLAAWTAAVSDGAGWLRRTTNARHVAAIGIGLGGLIAYRALATGAPIDDLVLWAAPSRGRALLRELRGHHQIIAAAFPEEIREDPDPGGDLELVGYVMSQETAADLGELNLTSLELARTPRRVLMLGRDGIGPEAKLADHLTAAGTDVDCGDGHDYAELMANPQQSVAPRRTMALTLEWLQQGSAPIGAPTGGPAGATEPASAAAAARGPVGATESAGTEAAAVRCRHAGVPLHETPLWFDGPQGRIFGVLTEPDGGASASLCVVLLGAGAVPHTGPNRSWVDLSRGWAARGVTCLRIDAAGVGESDGEDPHLRDDESFYASWRDGEVAAILDQLAEREVADRFVLGGLCSGAYRAVRRALVDPRVRGLLLLNLYAFDWSPELVSERGRRVAIAEGLPNARGHTLNREFVAKAMGYARPDRAWRLLRRSAERDHKRLALSALDALRDKRVSTLLLLGDREPLLHQFQRQGVTDRLDVWPNLTLDLPPSGDHMYRALWLQRHVYAALDAAVDRAVASLTAEPAAAGAR
ncbi:MAG TPA: hypothetical protein VGH45_03735 [Solirubrobacteraceae bacterium]